MAISSVGIGSGLEVEEIITKLVDLEKKPLETLESKAEFIESKISVQGQIRSMVTDLNDAVLDLSLDSTWNTVKVTNSNSKASASVTGVAATGSYNLNVTTLAQSQTAVSSSFAAGSTMGDKGYITFTLGNPGKAGVTLKTVDVQIASSDTLEQVAAKISNSDAGILASVVTAADGSQQLMLRARASGKDAMFAVQVTDLDRNPLAAGTNLAALAGKNDSSLLESSPISSVPSGQTGFFLTQSAQNASMTLNGVLVESNTNSFASVVPGLTISVSEVGSSLLSVTQDKDAIKTKIQEFVDAYNSLNKLLADSTKYDKDAGTAGVFQGDSSTVSMQNALRMLTQMTASNATGAFKRLSDIGIQMGNSVTGSAKTAGELVLDTTKLDTALNDLDSLKSLFASKDDSLGQGGGIAVRFKKFTGGLMDLEGALNNKESALDKEKERNSDAQTKVEKRATALETRLRAQYTALDVKMASLSSLSSYVEQMVTSWNKSD